MQRIVQFYIIFMLISCQMTQTTLLEIVNDTHNIVFISDHQSQATRLATQESITVESSQKAPLFFYTQHNNNKTFQLVCGLMHTIQHQEQPITDNHTHKITIMISEIFSATILFVYPQQFTIINQTDVARLAARTFHSKNSVSHLHKSNRPTACPTTEDETQNFLQSIKNQQQQIKNDYAGKEQSASSQEIMAHNIASFAAARQRNVHQFMRSSRR